MPFTADPVRVPLNVIGHFSIGAFAPEKFLHTGSSYNYLENDPLSADDRSSYTVIPGGLLLLQIRVSIPAQWER